MSGIDFEPKTSQLGIPSTSYSIQIGKVNGKWAIRLMKGKTVVDVLIYNDDDLEEDLPNQDILTNWVLRTVIIPGLNPLQIKKTIQFLLKEVKDRKYDMRIKVPIKEALDGKIN